MKHLIYSAIAFMLNLVLISCGTTEKTDVTGDVSFYEVPLVCAAAPEIGCGSKSKPILLGLEQQDEVVSEAWLNRNGTIIAVVWKENSRIEQREQASASIFKQNKTDATLISGKEADELRKEFEDKQNWYRTNDVDRLSMEEAEVIADRLIARVSAKIPLSNEQIDSLRVGMIQIFNHRFTQNYGSEINSNEQKVWEQNKVTIETEIIAVGAKYLNEEQLAQLKSAIALGLRPTEEEGQSNHGCSSPSDSNLQVP